MDKHPKSDVTKADSKPTDQKSQSQTFSIKLDNDEEEFTISPTDNKFLIESEEISSEKVDDQYNVTVSMVLKKGDTKPPAKSLELLSVSEQEQPAAEEPKKE